MSMFTFIMPEGVIPPLPGVSYDTSVRVNLKRFGSGTGSGGALLGGNNNDIDVDPTVTAEIASDLIRLSDGAATGISLSITNAFDGWANVEDDTDSTANFPAPTFDRGFRIRNTTDGVAELTLSGFNAYAEVRLYLAFDGVSGSFTTEDCNLTITDGDSTITPSIDTAPVSPSSIQFGGYEITADSSGDIVINLDSDFGSNNGVIICGIYFDYVA